MLTATLKISRVTICFLVLGSLYPIFRSCRTNFHVGESKREHPTAISYSSRDYLDCNVSLRAGNPSGSRDQRQRNYPYAHYRTFQPRYNAGKATG